MTCVKFIKYFYINVTHEISRAIISNLLTSLIIDRFSFYLFIFHFFFLTYSSTRKSYHKILTNYARMTLMSLSFKNILNTYSLSSCMMKKKKKEKESLLSHPHSYLADYISDTHFLIKIVFSLFFLIEFTFLFLLFLFFNYYNRLKNISLFEENKEIYTEYRYRR